MRALVVVSAVALGGWFAGSARAAEDCLAPLQQYEWWSCEAELSSGEVVEYCVEYTNAFGSSPDERYYKTTSTGMYQAQCACLAKGNTPAKGFGEDAGYLCLDRRTFTVVRGKASKTALVGETYNVGSNVRSTFTCRPNRGCNVPGVVDPDLPGTLGFLKLPEGRDVRYPVRGVGGEIDVGYIPGCQGYASEAPTFVFEVDGALARTLYGFVDLFSDEEDGRGILLMGPSGVAKCAPLSGANNVGAAAVPAVRGRVALWFLTNAPEVRLDGDFGAAHRP